MARAAPVWGLRSRPILVARLWQNDNFLPCGDLIHCGQHARWRASFIEQAESDQHWTFNSCGQIRRVVVTARFVNLLRIPAVRVVLTLRS